MEYESVFISLGVVLICVLAFFGTNGMVTYYNTEYNTSIGQDSETVNSIQHIQNNITGAFRGISGTMGNNVEGTDGGSTSSASNNLITSSLSIISSIKNLMGMPNALLNDASQAIGGAGSEYIEVAVILFIIVFAIVFGYLLLLGVQRLA